jgi:chromate reductase
MVAGKYDGERLVDDGSRAFFQTFIDSFAAWVERHAR